MEMRFQLGQRCMLTTDHEAESHSSTQIATCIEPISRKGKGTEDYSHALRREREFRETSRGIFPDIAACVPTAR